MTLQDWRLMRDRRLRALEEVTHVYRQSIPRDSEAVASPEELEARWVEESDYIELIHEAVHELRKALGSDMMNSYLVAGIPLERPPRMPQGRTGDQPIDLRAIRRLLPTVHGASLAGRQGFPGAAQHRMNLGVE